MSTAAVIAIAIGAVVVLGAISFLTLARRSDVRGAGALSSEAVKRDKARRSEEGVAVEEAVDAYRRRRRSRRASLPACPAKNWSRSAPTTRRWCRGRRRIPRSIGVSRRQFFNRATVTLMGAGLGAFAAASFVGFLWPSGSGGFGGAVTVGKLDDIKDGIKQGGGFFYAPEAKSWITEYPEGALRPPHATSTRPTSSPAWSPASSCSARSARTSAVVCPSARPASGSSASATGRSTTVSARRRAAPHHAAWTGSPSPCRRPVTSSSTPARPCPVRPSA